MSWGDEVAIEVEALHATYGHELHVDETLQQISMTVLPQQDRTQQQHFVQCQLQLTLPAAYPAEQPPDIQLQDVRGFVNRQEQLQQLLAADAVELTGELLLGLLFETTKAWLTDNNWAEGPCIFCLEDLAAATDSNTPTMRLPCFHAYHESCFAEWWCWQQQAYLQQQKALEEKTGATAAATLAQEALPPKHGQHFQLSCPTCRAAFQLRDLPESIQQQLRQHYNKQQQQLIGSKQQQQQQQAVARLTAAQLQPFAELQKRHAQLFARQQQRQGIIDTDVSYCIADWEGPSSSTVSSTTAAGEATVPAPSSAAAGSTATGRGNNSSSSSGGRGRGRGRGHHQPRMSDGSTGWDGSAEQQQPQQGQQQQQHRSHHGLHGHRRQQQQGWHDEQEWEPKPGRHQHLKGRGRGRQPQQQLQPQAVTADVHAMRYGQQQQQQPRQQQASALPRAAQRPLPPQQQRAAGNEQGLSQPEGPPLGGGRAASQRGGGRGRGLGRGRGAGRGSGNDQEVVPL